MKYKYSFVVDGYKNNEIIETVPVQDEPADFVYGMNIAFGCDNWRLVRVVTV